MGAFQSGGNDAMRLDGGAASGVDTAQEEIMSWSVENRIVRCGCPACGILKGMPMAHEPDECKIMQSLGYETTYDRDKDSRQQRVVADTERVAVGDGTPATNNPKTYSETNIVTPDNSPAKCLPTDNSAGQECKMNSIKDSSGKGGIGPKGPVLAVSREEASMLLLLQGGNKGSGIGMGSSAAASTVNGALQQGSTALGGARATEPEAAPKPGKSMPSASHTTATARTVDPSTIAKTMQNNQHAVDSNDDNNEDKGESTRVVENEDKEDTATARTVDPSTIAKTMQNNQHTVDSNDGNNEDKGESTRVAESEDKEDEEMQVFPSNDEGEGEMGNAARSFKNFYMYRCEEDFHIVQKLYKSECSKDLELSQHLNWSECSMDLFLELMAGEKNLVLNKNQQDKWEKTLSALKESGIGYGVEEISLEKSTEDVWDALGEECIMAGPVAAEMVETVTKRRRWDEKRDGCLWIKKNGVENWKDNWKEYLAQADRGRARSMSTNCGTGEPEFNYEGASADTVETHPGDSECDCELIMTQAGESLTDLARESQRKHQCNEAAKTREKWESERKYEAKHPNTYKSRIPTAIIVCWKEHPALKEKGFGGLGGCGAAMLEELNKELEKHEGNILMPEGEEEGAKPERTPLIQIELITVRRPGRREITAIRGYDAGARKSKQSKRGRQQKKKNERRSQQAEIKVYGRTVGWKAMSVMQCKQAYGLRIRRHAANDRKKCLPSVLDCLSQQHAIALGAHPHLAKIDGSKIGVTENRYFLDHMEYDAKNGMAPIGEARRVLSESLALDLVMSERKALSAPRGPFREKSGLIAITCDLIRDEPDDNGNTKFPHALAYIPEKKLLVDPAEKKPIVLCASGMRGCCGEVQKEANRYAKEMVLKKILGQEYKIEEFMWWKVQEKQECKMPMKKPAASATASKKERKHDCKLCMKRKGEESFSGRQWKKAKKGKEIICIDCNEQAMAEKKESSGGDVTSA